MPSKIKISKEDILNVALQIARKNGIENANVREIAKKLNCSVQPIYYQFENMENLKKELLRKIVENFFNFLTKNINESMPEYKQIGINYIKYAKKEPKLFQILFMSQNDLNIAGFNFDDKDSFSIIERFIGKSTKLKDEKIQEFHFKMWIFAHGIATLIAKDAYSFTDKQIQDLLSYEFQALMLLEENPNNKWVLKEGE